MSKKSFLFVFLFSSLSQAEEHRPFSEMHGGCEQFQIPVSKDLALWAKGEKTLSMGVDLPLGEKVIFGPLSSSPIRKQAQKHEGIP